MMQPVINYFKIIKKIRNGTPINSGKTPFTWDDVMHELNRLSHKFASKLEKGFATALRAWDLVKHGQARPINPPTPSSFPSSVSGIYTFSLQDSIYIDGPYYPHPLDMRNF